MQYRHGVSSHSKGYWKVNINPFRNKFLHRVWFEKVLGRPLRIDEEVDHMCHNRSCLNPGHWILLDAALHHAVSATNRNMRYYQKSQTIGVLAFLGLAPNKRERITVKKAGDFLRNLLAA